MSKNINITTQSNFYKEFRETNPALVLGLIIISFGLYIINWIYLRNKEFEELDTNSPNANRGAIIMMIIPFLWFFIIFILKKLIFSPDNLFTNILEIVGWGFIIFLLLKYLFDFCITYGKITRTNGLYWFFMFLFPVIGIVSSILGFYWLGLFIPLLLVVIPAMQAELNKQISKINLRQKSNVFYN